MMKHLIKAIIMTVAISTIFADEIIARDCESYDTIVVGVIKEWKDLGGFSDDGKPTDKEPSKRLIWARISIKKTLKSTFIANPLKSVDIMFFEPVVRNGEMTGYSITIKEFTSVEKIWSFNDNSNPILYPNFTFNSLDTENVYLKVLKKQKVEK